MTTHRFLGVGAMLAAVVATSVTSPALAQGGADPTAGTWRMITLSGPTQIPVPMPAQVGRSQSRLRG